MRMDDIKIIKITSTRKNDKGNSFFFRFAIYGQKRASCLYNRKNARIGNPRFINKQIKCSLTTSQK